MKKRVFVWANVLIICILNACAAPVVVENNEDTATSQDIWKGDSLLPNDTPLEYSNPKNVYTSEALDKVVALDGDTRWNFELDVRSLKNDVQDTSTGIVLSSSMNNGKKPVLFFVYQSGGWNLGYAPDSTSDYTFTEFFDQLNGSHQTFQLAILNQGKILQITSLDGFEYSHEFSVPLFLPDAVLKTEIQVGPQAALTVSKLDIEKKYTETFAENELAALETSTAIPLTVTATVPVPTSTSVVVTFPISGSQALPADFESQPITFEGTEFLKEIVRIEKSDLIIFDLKYWGSLWLAETNQGVKLYSEKWELLADLGQSQRRCSIRKNVNYNQPSNIYIGSGGIAVVGLDGVHIYTLDGRTEKSFVPLDKKYVVTMSSLSLCESSVFYASVSPDMNWISVIKLTDSYSTIEVFSGTTGKYVSAVAGEVVKIFSPDGQYLLTDNGDNRVVLYRTKDWSQLMLIRLDEYSFDYGFSPSSQYLFYFRASNAAVVFRMPDVNKTLVIKNAKSIWFNNSTEEVGAQLGNDKATIHVFDFETGQEVRTEKFSMDQWQPAVMETEKHSFPAGKFSDRENYGIQCAFKSNSSYSCSIGGRKCEFDLTGAEVCTDSANQPGVDYGRGSGHVVSNDQIYSLDSSNDGGVLLFNKKTGEQIRKEQVDSGKGALGVAFSNDSRYAAYVVTKAVYEDGAWLLVGNLVIYDLVEKKDVQKIKLDLYQGNVSVLAFSPKADLMAVGTFGGKVAFYDVSTGKLLYEFFPHAGMIGDLRFSPDGKWLLTAGGMDEMVKLWAVPVR
ncbi:MAG: WD40 repeat domain-containing protein [Anaerolineales bacterium]|nr:WD40 repeat domain-containing protein [Anaerolineales bacterium]